MTNMQEGEDLVSGLINSDGEFVDWDLSSLGELKLDFVHCLRLNLFTLLTHNVLIHIVFFIGNQKPISDDKALHQNVSENNKQHHEKQNKVDHHCKLCGKEFDSTSRLSQHKKNHRGVKTFECVHCGKKCAHRNALKVHLAIHVKQRPPPCPVSGNPGSERSHNNARTRKPTGTTSGVKEGNEAVSGFINSDGEEVEWDPPTNG